LALSTVGKKSLHRRALTLRKKSRHDDCRNNQRAERASALAKSSAAQMRTASAKDRHGLRGVSGARQRSGGVEKYSSIASQQAPECGSTAISPWPDSRISAAVFSAQLMRTSARSIPQPVQLQLDL
jgi:hypothetical protein